MRLDERNIVIVETLVDVKQVIQEFMPGERESLQVQTKLKADGKVYEVSAPVDCDYRNMLLEGFTIVKKRVKALSRERETELGIEPVSVDGRMWLDDLIHSRLGGVRDGLRIKWELQEGVFYFDPFTGKLTKCS